MAIAFVSTTLPVPVIAQTVEPSARNAVYFELGGNAILYSLNYDLRMSNTWTGRAGFMVVSGAYDEGGDGNDSVVTLIPLMANALIGKGTHRLELGIGPLIVIGAEAEDDVAGDVEVGFGAGLGGVTGTFGYRRQPLDGGFVFRASITPFLLREHNLRPYLWGGLSAGWAF